jgi:hypothetical protein
MSVNRSENTKDNELFPNTQPFVTRRIVATFAFVLIALPLLPALISNLAYSFSGHAPKIYWYLSRAGGFIALSILWVSMAMGLGLTNKLARWWPGAPAAFAVHEYVSLLGLLFAIYHALVLIGDHYVDFSLPRLLLPFSIRYEPFWVGLGQTAFYTWVVVLLSFYIRQFIGQKTWRMIHYANFATYMMGLFHGLFSGTDGTASWAHWYYGISAGTLIALVVYRVYITIHKKPASRPKPVSAVEHSPQVQPVAVTPTQAIAEAAPQTPSLEQVSAPLESPAPIKQPAPVSEPVMVPTVTENIPQFLSMEQEEVPVSEYVITETQLSNPEPTPIVIKIFNKISIPSADPTLPQKRNLHRNQIQMPSYLEPATIPSQRTLRIQKATQSKQDPSMEWEKVVIPNVRIIGYEHSKQTQSSPLLQRVKENLRPKNRDGS